ncbi:Ribophorin I [Polychytrium aggregatum]|uniref:Ribophorin I n=1 Tax=Polychytrium aggregatum TaxID=110093 RepID=UPI0022FE3C25|nr:Ribophorin I [Polychytrium aggregatum]KAI9205279.1 Ribophorin I [Polychytrium aggregatum]
MKSVHTHRGLRLLLGVLVALLCFSQHVLAGSKGDKEDVKAVPVSIPQHLVNSNLHRFIDLSSPIVRERTTIIIQNKGESPASEYWLSVPAALADASLSLLTAKTAPKKEAPQDLLVEKSQFDAANDVQYFKVKLASPLAKDEKLTLQINVAYTHVLKPYPKAIAQSDVQFVEFSDSVYFHTPYFTEKQRITVHLPTSNVKNYTNANLPVVKKGTDIVYGPYTAVDAFERSPLYVHFEFPRIVAVARNYEKEIELSHWGNNMFVKEHYELHNEGAKLKGHYARVDLYFKAIPNALRALDITLPPNIKNVFYRDAIGNVSTSNFHQNSQRSLLQIKPRYPVFGGWKYTWHHTFDVPLDQFVKKDAHRDRYILQVPILGSIPNVTVDHGHFKIILPEGASFVEILSPYTFDKQTFVKHYTVFDSTGRQAVVLEKRNMVDEFGAPIQIVYDFPAWRIFQKPLVVSAAFGAIFLIGIIAARLDLSISKASTTR